MRELTDAQRIHAFMEALGRRSRHDAQLYFTGGATAVLIGWRPSTIDVDILLVPDDDALLRALPELKESLHINIELACPADFVPELPGWRDRSAYVGRHGKIAFRHYDFYAQALAKIERGHGLDIADVRAMLERGLVEPGRLLGFFTAIEPHLYRYPAIDPASFRRAVEAAAGGAAPSPPGAGPA